MAAHRLGRDPEEFGDAAARDAANGLPWQGRGVAEAFGRSDRAAQRLRCGHRDQEEDLKGLGPQAEMRLQREGQ
ncbi:MAG: hypothetical protein ACK4KW_03070 [Gemmobacter sp.]